MIKRKLKNMLRFLNKYVGDLYFVTKGERVGQFLVFIKKDKDKRLFSVLTLPDCEPIYISEKEMSGYVEDNTVEYVETVPQVVLKDCILEFNLRNSVVKR